MELQEFSNVVECKICKQLKPKIKLQKYPNGKDCVYRDSVGGLWNGKTCPSCYRDIQDKRMKNKRSNVG
jgi:hypothetical protein